MILYLQVTTLASVVIRMRTMKSKNFRRLINFVDNSDSAQFRKRRQFQEIVFPPTVKSPDVQAAENQAKFLETKLILSRFLFRLAN